MPRWPWRRRDDDERRDGRHAPPEVERASAELYGKLDLVCRELERMVAERERELRDAEDGEDGEDA